MLILACVFLVPPSPHSTAFLHSSHTGECKWRMQCWQHCLIIKCRGLYKQKALSNSGTRKVYKKTHTKNTVSVHFWELVHNNLCTVSIFKSLKNLIITNLLFLMTKNKPLQAQISKYWVSTCFLIKKK